LSPQEFLDIAEHESDDEMEIDIDDIVVNEKKKESE
jgi:hypothetical protein